ncbi:Endonuclease/exonuclease/phosphatase [Globomyces pollinis-pini]|nr:Endonuclease/exonuclease/phosphatase [Globomyces pollinis-pini]KAJ2994019.1 hypothetical protein HDV02_001906 [Globomyces sp. JEL0801]
MMKTTIQIGSWNVAEMCPKQSLDLTPWLEKSLSPSPDIIAIGLQEIKSQVSLLITPAQESYWCHTNHTRHGSEIVGLEPWIDLISKTIEQIHGQGEKYRPLWAGRRCGFGLIVYTKVGVIAKSVYTGHIGTGLLGMYGNKGAIGIGLEFELEKYPNQVSTFCFINTHLQAHEGESNCLWRQEEANHILSTLFLKPLMMNGNCKELDCLASNPHLLIEGDRKSIPVTEFSKKLVEAGALAQDYELIWFFGDLNYRIKGSKANWGYHTTNIKDKNYSIPTYTQLQQLIESESVTQLLLHDELKFLMDSEQGILAQFKESAINFLPTFKFKKSKGTQIVVDDTTKLLSNGDEKKHIRIYDSKRLPSYTDRILFFNSSYHTITNLLYTGITRIHFSDHNPVVGLYHLERVNPLQLKPLKRVSSIIFWQRVDRFFHVNSVRLLVLVSLLVVWVAWRWV